MKPQSKAGLINQPAMLNVLLKQAEDKVENSLTSNVYSDYMKIVVAGMKAAMAGGPKSIFASIKTSKDPMTSIVKGMISLIFILKAQSKGQMPSNAMIPAAHTLMLQGLDFAEKVGVLKIGKAELAQATHLFINTIMPKLGLTQNRVQAIVQQVRGVSNDPAKVAQLKQAQQQRGQPKAMQQPIGAVSAGVR